MARLIIGIFLGMLITFLLIWVVGELVEVGKKIGRRGVEKK